MEAIPSLAQLFEKQVNRSPLAIACVHGEKTITYQTLNEEANKLARYLQEQGVGNETLVGINGARSIECIIGILAIIKAGGAYVPLDPSNPGFRLGQILKESQVTLVLTEKNPSAFLQQTDTTVIRLDELPAKIKDLSVENMTNTSNENNLANVMYTSGSTGKPKGVMILQHSIINLIQNQPCLNISSENTIMHIANLGFDASTFEIWGALLNGATLVIVDQLALLDFSKFKRILSQNSKVCCFITSSLFEEMIIADPAQFKGCDQIIFGGDVCNAKTIMNYIVQSEKANLPRLLINAYGPTECTTFSTCFKLDLTKKYESISIGRSLNNVTVQILDAKLKPVPKLKVGELYIGGQGLARGYLNQKELTESRFIVKKGERLYRTGDFGRMMEDGEIEYHGRTDSQFKIRGYRVEAAEIERLIQEIPDVENALVTLERKKNGEGELTAYLTISKDLIRMLYKGKCKIKWADGEIQDVKVIDLSHGGICVSGIERKTVHKEIVTILLPELLKDHECTSEVIWQSKAVLGLHFIEPNKLIDRYIDNHYKEGYDIIPQHRNFKAILKKRLPDYMVPEKYIALSNFPLNSNGKIDKTELQKLYSSLENTSDDITDKEEAKSVSEEIMMQLWRDALSTPNIGREDNFFQLGGHSLLATKIISKLKKNYHANINIKDFFTNPMLSQLAVLIANDLERSEYAPIESSPRAKNSPLSFSQQRMWFFEQLHPQSPLYNIVIAINIEGDLQVEALQHALRKLTERHEILRTEYHITPEGKPYQKVLNNIPLPFTTMANINADQDTLNKCIKTESETPFSLNAGPLYRVLDIKLSQKAHQLVVTFHHSIADGWSLEIFAHELSEFYNAYLEKREPILPKLTVQYIDYAVWEHLKLNREKTRYNDLIKFWSSHLENAPLLPILPVDQERTKDLSYRAGIVNFKIDKRLTSSLKRLSINANSTLYMTLFSAFYFLLANLSGKKDIIIGTPVANRNRAEIENLIGCFVNTLPVRVSSTFNIEFYTLLQDIKKTLLECYKHDDLPFEVLVENDPSQHKLSHHPLFQIMFAMHSMLGKEFNLVGNKIKTAEEINVPFNPFDLFVSIEEKENELEGYMQYSQDLFKEETVKLWAEKWILLLQHISSNSQIKLNEIKFI